METNKSVVDVIKDVNHNKATNIGKKFSFEDLQQIWEKLSNYIKNMLKDKKSVSIKNLGVFTLRKWEVYAGMHHEVKQFETVFLLSKKLQEDFDLHQRKQYVTDKIPVTPINILKIALECNLSKETVILTIDEIVQCLRRLLANKCDVKLLFPDLGELNILKSNVTFNFAEKIESNKNIIENPCRRYETALKPYFKQSEYPCSMHASQKRR